MDIKFVTLEDIDGHNNIVNVDHIVRFEEDINSNTFTIWLTGNQSFAIRVKNGYKDIETLIDMLINDRPAYRRERNVVAG